MSHIRDNKKEEENAIEAKDENPKYFYRYAKLKALIKALLGPQKKMDGSEDLVKNNAEMYEMLGEQYVSVYSVPLPNVELPSNDNDLDNHGISVLTEVQAATGETMTSIEELRCNSSAGPDGEPQYYCKRHADPLLYH